MRDYASLRTSLLSDLGFEDSDLDYHIYSDMDHRSAASLALAKSFYSKLCPAGDTKIADAAALEKFLSINDSLPDEPIAWFSDSEAESCFYDFYRDNLRVALEPHESFGTFDLDFIRENMMVGPGAAQKADSRCMITKLFQSPMSYTNEHLITWYRSALVGTGSWADAEMQRFQEYGFTQVKGGKIFFAPKKTEISRTCCTEASLNVLIQKACGAFIEVRLGHFFNIFLKSQPDLNRELARLGSIYQTIGTIDLISASDSIGLQLIKRDIPDGFFKAVLLNSRSEYAILPDGSQVKLRMVSTMGNGFTFPLQTLIFACVVRAVYQCMGFPCTDPSKEFGVFGDDIIVRREAYDFVVKMLTKLGFTVNGGKSFNTGPFRESCGYDYTNGQNIRGVYIKSLETPQEVVSAINRLTRWSAIHEISLEKTIKMLRSWTRDIRVPLSESDDGGIKVPFVLSRSRLTDSYWFQYRVYKKRLRRLVIDSHDEAGVPYNEYGIAVGYMSGHLRRRDILLTTTDWESGWSSALAGDPSCQDSAWKHDWSCSVTLRDGFGAKSRYKVCTAHIPYWDYLPPKKQVQQEEYEEYSQVLTDLSHQRWKALMVELLNDS